MAGIIGRFLPAQQIGQELVPDVGWFETNEYFYFGDEKDSFIYFDGNDFVVESTGSANIRFKTTSRVVIPVVASGSGIEIYNTTDETGAFERFEAYWSTTPYFYLRTKSGTGGTPRALYVQSSTTSSSAYGIFNVNATDQVTLGTSAASYSSGVKIAGSPASSSLTQNILNITPNISQSGTAGYRAIRINVTETTLGSGTQELLNLAVGGTDYFVVDNNGEAQIGGLRNQGSMTINRTEVNTATYTVAGGDYLLGVTYTATGAVTINLPAAATVGAGAMFVIKDEGGSASLNNITIDPNGTEQIDGQATYTINTDGGSVTIYTDGSNWFII